jgi:hypothetical protein
LISANVGPTPARRSSDVDWRRIGRIAGADRERPGSQPEVIDELGGIKTDKHAGGAVHLDDVVVGVFAWLVNAKFRLAADIGEDLASPVDFEADVMVHRHVGVEVINDKAIGDVVSRMLSLDDRP